MAEVNQTTVECRHNHAVNYANEDPTTAYPDGQLRCLDCGVMFKLPERPLTVKVALAELRAMFPSEHIVISIRDCGEECVTLRGTALEYVIQIGMNGEEFDADTLNEAMDQVRQWHRDQQEGKG